METTEKLKELLGLCISKGINFDYSHTGVITVSLLDANKEIFAVYYRKRIYHQDILDLIEKVKNYNP